MTRRAIPQQQINALVAIPAEPYATLVLTLEQTGLRIGEAAALNKSDFDDTLIHTDGGDGFMLHVTRRIYRREVGPLKTKKSYRPLLVSEELKERMFRILAASGYSLRAAAALWRDKPQRVTISSCLLGAWDYTHALA